ncbi:hypothetical protein OMAG_000340 [Candidatus Omnitrophus magneticus]|uniref:Uncharacterized protein n=1 Tax=Candidatus Omnitrophus magneticus TaxID=1609969 RepID=A0A0F0CW54_9BACT|nr:hypothetical protein OMAG_000340 [Candidatus Omnitrophus magneticus]
MSIRISLRLNSFLEERHRMKNRILDEISGEDALEILKILANGNNDVALAIEREAKKILKRIDIEEISEEVYSVLDGIEVEELWDRSGPRSYGYSAPEDMSIEMMEEKLSPYNEQIEKYFKLEMMKEADLYCKGVLKGLYRYAKESMSEFKEYVIDMTRMCFGSLLSEYNEKINNEKAIEEMKFFLKKECSEWEK